MMKKIFFLLAINLFLSGCSTLATGGAEVSGLSLLHDRRTTKVIAKDEGIELKAMIELRSHDDTRNNSHVNVTAFSGVVLVSGEALTEPLRDKIISIVRVISGVKLVHNNLTVEAPSPYATRSNDTFITTKVKSSLSGVKNLPGFDATRVKVVTESGTVYLLGLVYSKEGNVAAEIARREEGVKRVVKVFEYID